MDSKDSEIEISIPPEMSGMFRKYHDRTLADDSLLDPDVVLLSVYLTDRKNKKSGIKYGTLKKLFVHFGRKEGNFTKTLYRVKDKALLKEEDKNIHLLILGLKRIEEIFKEVGKSAVYIIKSGQNFTAINLFEEFLKNEINNEEVLLCDSYIDDTTLHSFNLKGKIKSLKILTANIFDPDKFNDRKKKLRKELNVAVEVKVNKKIHDRFIVIGDSCWSIGASIKDLGNKDVVIKEIGEVASSMRTLFTERWQEVDG